MLQRIARRTIMIVGNGMLPDGAAEIIDGADVVIRFNHCGSFGQGGQKTDIVAVCNTGRPALAMLSGEAWKSSAAVGSAAAIWCVRPPQAFEALRPRLAETRPDLADFCDDYTSEFATFAKATGRDFHVVPMNIHDHAVAELTRLNAPDYVAPSSGLIVILEVLAHWQRHRDRVCIAGFGHAGWSGHPFATERVYIDGLVAAGRLDRLDDPTAAAPKSSVFSELQR